MKTFCARVIACFFLATGLIAAQSAAGPERIISEALKPSSLETNLRQLSDQVGGRVTGTPQMQKAVDWGLAVLKAAGGANVHAEEFTVPHAWGEGATQMKVVAPEEFTVRAISLGWAPALPPHQHVRIVDVGYGTPADFSKAGGVQDAVLLVHSEEMKTWDDLFAEYLNAPGIVDRAINGKALAIAFQSTRPNDLLYRHTNAIAGEIDRIPMVLVTREDGSRMGRLLASGQSLYADIAIPNQIGGPLKAANVIAEIAGTEQPDQFVLLGAHLDSWDLGTGALDNGCNAALVVDALRAIKDSGLQPRRTIRFALFSGEE